MATYFNVDAFNAMGLSGANNYAAIMMLFMLGMVILSIACYIYFGFALMNVAKKTKTESAWLAWIPFGNMFLMSKIAKSHWWPLLLFAGGFISIMIGSMLTIFQLVSVGLFLVILGFVAFIVAGVFFMIWIWKICEARNRPGWWALISLVAIFFYVVPAPFNWIVYAIGMIWSFLLWGILAWGRDIPLKN